MNQNKKQKQKPKQHREKPMQKTPEIEPGKRHNMTEVEPGKIETHPEDAPLPPGDYPAEPYRDEEEGLEENGGAEEQQPSHA